MKVKQANEEEFPIEAIAIIKVVLICIVINKFDHCKAFIASSFLYKISNWAQTPFHLFLTAIISK